MEILAAAVLGIVQGLTEFLPISSSAHLILMPWFFGWEPEGLSFDVSLHVGTAVAVLAYFWRDWINLAREIIRGFIEGRPLGNYQRRLAWYLAIGTVPAVVTGLTLENTIEKHLRSPLITIATLAIFGAFLYLAQIKSRQDRKLENYSWADSIWIGLSQAIALIPGVSRSGITITTAMLRNSKRPDAARFSFLLSTPVIVGAGILQGWELIRPINNPTCGGFEADWTVIAVGILSAAITGFFCIRFFLRYLQTKSFTPFIIYRMVLATIILMYYLIYF